MFRVTRTLRINSPVAPSFSRAYRPSYSLLNAASATHAPPEHSATKQQHGNSAPGKGKGNTTSHSTSATDYNSPKDPLKDKQEAEAAEAGPAAADAQYGGGNIVEGNYTAGTKQAQDRKEAGKQGEH
ncbi:hypothetical protein JCM11641_007007 [Rhodosporidiobolus odoratus]